MPIMSEIAMRVILRLNIPQGGLWLVGPAAVKSEIGKPSNHQNVSMISKLDSPTSCMVESSIFPQLQ